MMMGCDTSWSSLTPSVVLSPHSRSESVFEKDRRVCVTHLPCDQLWASDTTQQVKTGGRPDKHPRRALVDAILYVVRAGCAWRQLPGRLPALADRVLVLQPLGTVQGHRAD